MVTRIPVALVANQVVANALQGQSIEFAPDDSVLSLAVAGTAAADASLRLTDEVVLDNSAAPIRANGPILPDDLLLTKQAVARGDHLILRVADTSGAANTVWLLVDVSPI